MWLQTHLTVDKSRAPLIELLFEGLGALSITLGDAGDEPMLEPGLGETPLWSATRVTGLFSGETDADHLRSEINQALDSDVSRHLKLEHLQDQDWERAWLDRFAPMCFGQHLWICPSECRVDARDAVIVDLDPGLAFGTGTHPTTGLCLQWLDGADLADKTLIDFGSGSGVLAIAALKLGAAQAIAVDHDPQAIIASRDNAQRNGVANRLQTFISEDFPSRQADIVVANILANVLVDLAGLLKSLIRPGGQLILSGILNDQVESVTQAYADQLDFEPVTEKDGWVLLAARRRS